MRCLLCDDEHEITSGVLLVTDGLYIPTFNDGHLISTRNLRFHLAAAMIDGADLEDLAEYICLTGNSVVLDVSEEVGMMFTTHEGYGRFPYPGAINNCFPRTAAREIHKGNLPRGGGLSWPLVAAVLPRAPVDTGPAPPHKLAKIGDESLEKTQPVDSVAGGEDEA